MDTEPSDFDFAIVSNSLFEKAKKQGVELDKKGVRTQMLSSSQLKDLKLIGLNKAASGRVGRHRKFSFVIFPDAETLKDNGPYMVVK